MNQFVESFSKKLELGKKKNKNQKPFVLSVTSGKGGVGKTLTTVNLALAARKMGKEVLVLDGDLGLANVDVVLGLQARYNINDVLENQIPLSQIIIEGPMGMKIIPSASGVSRLTRLSYAQRIQIIDEIETLDSDFDLIIIDTGAGIDENVTHFNLIADKALIVTTTEPHALTDAYAMIKVLNENYGKKQFYLLINMVSCDQIALKVYERIAEVAKRFLGVNVNYVGSVPHDPQIQKSVINRRAASENSVCTVAGQAWTAVMRDIIDNIEGRSGGRTQKEIWRDIVGSHEMTMAGI